MRTAATAFANRLAARARRAAVTPEDPAWVLLPVTAFVWTAGITFYWLAQDQPFFFWDAGVHILSAADFLADSGAYLSRAEQRYPPFGQIVLGGIYLLTGHDLKATIAAFNLSFLALLLASTFAIGREQQSARVGATAVAVLVCYPEVFIRLRFPLLDLPFSALLMAAFYALLRTGRFESRSWSVVFGLLVGLAQITKHIAILFAILPALWVLWQARRSLRVAANVGWAAVAASVVALPWWVPRLDYYLNQWLAEQRAFAADFASLGTVGTFSVIGLAYYSLGLWYVTSFGFALLFLLALRGFIARDDRHYVLCIAAATWVVSTLVASKQTRYALPLLPAVALVTAAGVDRMRKGGLIFAVAIALGCLQTWAISFGLKWLPEGEQVHPTTLREPIQLFSQHTHMEMGFRPDPLGWGLAGPFGDLRGRIGIFETSPPAHNPYRVGFLAEGLALQHLAARARGDRSTVAEGTSCNDPAPLERFDLLLVPVGDAESAFAPSGRTGLCTAGFRERNRIPVRRPPGRDPNDFWRLREIVVLEREAPPTSFRVMGIVHQRPSTEGGLSAASIDAVLSRDGITRVGVTVRNMTGQAHSGSVLYVVAPPEMDPWQKHTFASVSRPFTLGGWGEIFLELPGTPNLATGVHNLVVALHEMDERTRVAVPRHTGGAIVRIAGPPS